MRLGFDLHGAVPGILGVDSCVTPHLQNFTIIVLRILSPQLAIIQQNSCKDMDFFVPQRQNRHLFSPGVQFFLYLMVCYVRVQNKKLYRTAKWTECRVKEESDLELSRQTDYFP